MGASSDTINEITFSLVPEIFEKDKIIFKPEDIADKMYIIQNGMVEIYTIMDNEITFILEKLYRGSVINNKSFLLQDSIDVYAKTATTVGLYYISLEKFNSIRLKSAELNEQIGAIEDLLVDKENAVALDYVISKKKSQLKRPEAFEQYRNSLTVQLKNAAMYYIVKYREERRIPKFKDIMMMAI